MKQLTERLLGTTAFTFTDYQERGIKAALRDLAEKGRALLVGPTGSGKTATFVEIAGRLADASPNIRILVLQHRSVLLEQNYAALCARLPHLSRAAFGSGFSRHVKRGVPAEASLVFGLVQTAQNVDGDSVMRYCGAFDLLIIDEAHAAASGSYRRAVCELIDRNPDMMVLGATATPERFDGADLSWLFGRTPTDVVTIEEAIAAGRVMAPEVLTLADAETRDLAEVQAAIRALEADGEDDAEVRALKVDNAAVVAKWKLYSKGRRTVMFCQSVQHADMLAEAFNAAGVEAVSVDHQSTPAQRRRVIDDLSADRGARVVCNAFLLSEGFDCPALACVGLNRAFLSRALMIQCAGRALRFAPGKPKPLVLDFSAQWNVHKGMEQRIELVGVRGESPAPESEPLEERSPYACRRPLVAPDVVMQPAGIFGGDPSDTPDTPPTPTGGAGPLRLISRCEAIARGLKRYFTGKPCANGHVSERRIQNDKCVSCDKGSPNRPSRTNRQSRTNRPSRTNRQSIARRKVARKTEYQTVKDVPRYRLIEMLRMCDCACRRMNDGKAPTNKQAKIISLLFPKENEVNFHTTSSSKRATPTGGRSPRRARRANGETDLTTPTTRTTGDEVQVLDKLVPARPPMLGLPTDMEAGDQSPT